MVRRRVVIWAVIAIEAVAIVTVVVTIAVVTVIATAIIVFAVVVGRERRNGAEREKAEHDRRAVVVVATILMRRRWSHAHDMTMTVMTMRVICRVCHCAAGRRGHQRRGQRDRKQLFQCRRSKRAR